MIWAWALRFWFDELACAAKGESALRPTATTDTRASAVASREPQGNSPTKFLEWITVKNVKVHRSSA